MARDGSGNIWGADLWGNRVEEFARTIAVVAEAVAKRAGRSRDDLAVRTVAGAIIGVIMSISMPWQGWSSAHGFEDMFGGSEFAEGLAAFSERRRPEYR